MAWRASERLQEGLESPLGGPSKFQDGLESPGESLGGPREALVDSSRAMRAPRKPQDNPDAPWRSQQGLESLRTSLGGPPRGPREHLEGPGEPPRRPQ